MRDLFYSYQKAVCDHDGRAVLDCLEPALRKEAAKMLAAYAEFSAQSDGLQELLSERFGREAGEYFREHLFDPVSQQYQGVLLWSDCSARIGREITIDGSPHLARLVVDGSSIGIEAARIDGKWAIYFSPERMAGHYLDRYRLMLTEANQEVDRISEGVKRGTVTNANVKEVLSGK
ncbi:MAG: hypothetical protein ABFD92_17735 [Planctomycetaceae bacterium]|nr:hypothetical protein [Planctomycetaceae bacterium]